MKRGLSVVAVAVVALAACGSDSKSAGSGGGGGGKLFPDELQAVCQGATQSRATPYVATAAAHKVVYFETYKDNLQENVSTLPQDWMVTFSQETDEYAKVDLVACGVRTQETFVKDCPGYTDEGSSDSKTVKLFDATYEVSVHEATTGKTLASQTMTASDTDCPMLASFDKDEDTVNDYASPNKDDIVAFVKPFAQP